MIPIESSTIVFSTTLLSKLFKNVSKRIIEKLKSDDQNERSKTFRMLWAAMIVILIIFTALLIGGIYAGSGNIKTGLLISTILWAIILGVSGLLFLSQKALSAIFGFFLGTSISEIGSASGLISVISSLINNISLEISKAIPSAVANEGQNSFVTLLVWIFFIIIILICLPAFFISEKK